MCSLNWLIASATVVRIQPADQIVAALLRRDIGSNQAAQQFAGRGRACDNIFVESLWRTVKYEDVYLNGYASMGELMLGLKAYLTIYSQDGPMPSRSASPPCADQDSLRAKTPENEQEREKYRPIATAAITI